MDGVTGQRYTLWIHQSPGPFPWDMIEVDDTSKLPHKKIDGHDKPGVIINKEAMSL